MSPKNKNPYAKALRQSRYKKQVVPDKKKAYDKRRFKFFELLERFR